MPICSAPSDSPLGWVFPVLTNSRVRGDIGPAFCGEAKQHYFLCSWAFFGVFFLSCFPVSAGGGVYCPYRVAGSSTRRRLRLDLPTIKCRGSDGTVGRSEQAGEQGRGAGEGGRDGQMDRWTVNSVFVRENMQVLYRSVYLCVVSVWLSLLVLVLVHSYIDSIVLCALLVGSRIVRFLCNIIINMYLTTLQRIAQTKCVPYSNMSLTKKKPNKFFSGLRN